MKLVLGTRGSDLALAQSRRVAALLSALPEAPEVEIRIIQTSGDRIIDRSLAAAAEMIGGDAKGLFTKELEDALLSGAIDFAVHSYKDMPSLQPPGLSIRSVPERSYCEDVIVFLASKAARGVAPFVAAGATLGSSSARRRALVQSYFPDLKLVDLRGNVPTRIKKLTHADGPDAILLARAGLERLRAVGLFERDPELQDIFQQLRIESLDPRAMPPAPAQGALAIECRSADRSTQSWLDRIHNAAALQSVELERALLARLEGGCHLPLGAHARIDGGSSVQPLQLFAFLGAEAADNRLRRSRWINRGGRHATDLATAVAAEFRETRPLLLTGKRQRIAEIQAARPGASILALPLLETAPLRENFRPLQTELSDWLSAIGGEGMLAAFSASGVEAFAEFCSTIDAASLAALPQRWAVVGAHTEAAVAQRFPKAHIVVRSPDGSGRALASELLKSGLPPSVLALSAERGREDFYQLLQDKTQMLRLRLYETRSVEAPEHFFQSLPEQLHVLFGSPSAVKAYFEAEERQAAAEGRSDWLQAYLRQHRTCNAIGPTTAAALRERGLPCYAQAAEADYAMLCDELSGALDSRPVSFED
ncbi:MAG: hydroxymethylbilane synthase [Leptospirales bacterium]|nr:hydroxymethylbilane synthase [Leptospirales bacterium]